MFPLSTAQVVPVTLLDPGLKKWTTTLATSVDFLETFAAVISLPSAIGSSIDPLHS